MAEVSDVQLAQLGVRLERISVRVNSFGNSLTSISNQIAEASSLERMKEKQEQDRERILAQQALREGKESVFESKMQNALVAPLEKVAAPAASILDRLKQFFLGLGIAWLTGRGFEALQAEQEGNRSKLEEIKNEILQTLRKVYVTFAVARFGIGRIISTFFNVAGKITNAVYQGLIKKPFTKLVNAIRGALRTAVNAISRLAIGRNILRPRTPVPPKPTTPGTKPPGKAGGIFGTFLTGVQSFMNLKNGEYVDAAIGAMSILGPGKYVKGLMALGYAADEIAEAFGMNIFGKDPNAERTAKDIVEEARSQSQQKNQTQTPAETSSNVQPTESLMGDSSKPGSDDKVEPNTVPSPDFKTEEELMKSDQTSVSSGGSTSAPPPAQTSSSGSSSPSPAQVSPSSTSKASMSSGSMGPTPEPAPQVNIIPPSSQTPQSVPAEGSRTAASIPRVVSSNKDNFYTLYSQVNYNVVT